jgi:hypothetical protein
MDSSSISVALTRTSLEQIQIHGIVHFDEKMPIPRRRVRKLFGGIQFSSVQFIQMESRLFNQWRGDE